MFLFFVEKHQFFSPKSNSLHLKHQDFFSEILIFFHQLHRFLQ